MATLTTLAAVAAGGALGAAARYLTGAAALRALGPGFPWGTLAVNLLGGFLMGFLAFALLARADGAFARWGPFLLTGVLGGFTTFSAFALDALTLVERGEAWRAAAYVAASVAGSIGALAAGAALARAL